MKPPALSAFNKWARAEAQRILGRRLRAGDDVHKIIVERLELEAKRARSGPLGALPMIHNESDALVATVVQQHDRAARGAGARARAHNYAPVKSKVLAAWDALPAAARAARGAKKRFAIENARKDVTIRTILAWIENRD